MYEKCDFYKIVKKKNKDFNIVAGFVYWTNF